MAHSVILFAGCQEGAAPINEEVEAQKDLSMAEPVEEMASSHGSTGDLGWMYADVAMACAQENIDFDQQRKIGEYIESEGDKEAGVDKAMAEGIITEEQAKIVKFMFGDKSQLDPATANQMENDLLESVGYTPAEGGYPIVDTNVTIFYDANGEIEEPQPGEPFYGQDGHYEITPCDYTDNGDGTISDNVTGLMWQKESDQGKKITWEEAMNGLDAFNAKKLGGHDDWRIPTIKELYSLAQYSGVYRNHVCEVPYFDDDYFVALDSLNPGDRSLDVQTISSTIYDSVTLGRVTTMFGFNFRDGCIKGYPSTKTFTLYHVRGNTHYGQNIFVDNGNGTISDLATGLMWMTCDSGWFDAGEAGNGTMNWEDALAWCERLGFGGHTDWRLPSAKELQSIVDYNRSPDTTDSPAIDPIFQCTEIKNLGGIKDWAYYWAASPFRIKSSVYVAFGRGMGMFGGYAMDVHGAGSQKADDRDADRADYPEQSGAQGDENHVFNMVRAVRTID